MLGLMAKSRANCLQSVNASVALTDYEDNFFVLAFSLHESINEEDPRFVRVIDGVFCGRLRQCESLR